MPPAALKKPARKPVRKKLRIRSQREWLRLAPFMDALVDQYKTPAYIANDPIQMPHRFIGDPRACELSGFITALFSYGRRDLIIETMSQVFQIMENDPTGFLESFDPKRDAKLFQHFVYRFNKGRDLVYLLERLQWAYREFGSLENLFIAQEREDLKGSIAGFTDALLGDTPLDTYGIKFLFAHPDKGGACKRFNMFLRWMVRDDEPPPVSPDRAGAPPSAKSGGKVDFGLWKKALKPSDLIVPLDTHILKMNGHLRMSARQTGSWETAEEITDVFRLLCPQDPVKYDYALFGFSLDRRSPEEMLTLWQSAL